MTIVQEVDLDPGEVYQELHEPEHIALVIDGLADSIQQDLDGVVGNESLTSSQHYLEGVLRASGSISYSSVAGNEGFLSSVSSGIQKAWEYIKKMFAYIFGGFLKKDSKTKVEETKTSVKDANDAIKSAESPKVTPANVEKAIKEVQKKVDRLKDSPEKKKLVEKVEATKEEKSDQVKVRDIIELLPQVFDSRVGDDLKIKAASDKLESSVAWLEKRIDEYKANDEHGFDDMPTAIGFFLNGLIGLPKTTGIKDFASAKKFTAKAESCLSDMANMFKGLEANENVFKEAITETEEKLSKYKEGKNKQDLLDDLASHKARLTGITEVIKVAQAVMGCVKDIAGVIEDACVLVI